MRDQIQRILDTACDTTEPVASREKALLHLMLLIERSNRTSDTDFDGDLLPVELRKLKLDVDEEKSIVSRIGGLFEEKNDDIASAALGTVAASHQPLAFRLVMGFLQARSENEYSKPLDQAWRSLGLLIFHSDPTENDFKELVSLLRSRLGRLPQRGYAIKRMLDLPEQSRRELINDVLGYTVFQNGWTHEARDVVLSVSREWLIDSFDVLAGPILNPKTMDDFAIADIGGLLSFWEDIDPQMTKTVARRLTTHSNAELRELGEEFLKG